MFSLPGCATKTKRTIAQAKPATRLSFSLELLCWLLGHYEPFDHDLDLIDILFARYFGWCDFNFKIIKLVVLLPVSFAGILTAIVQYCNFNWC